MRLMTTMPGMLALLGALSLSTGPCAAAQRPDWAFFVPTAAQAAPPPPQDPGKRQHVAGSSITYSLAQVQDALNPPDWYPEEHPAMPVIVAHGSAPNAERAFPLLPCALCHLPNGAGHVESASLAGLPVEYIVRQFAEIRGADRCIQVGTPASAQFLTLLKTAYSAEQVRAAAAYYSALELRTWIHVREVREVPRSVVDAESLMRTAAAGGAGEPIGARIVELPISESALRKRDSHSGFVAYVPEGSIARGKALADGAAGGTRTACAGCHGPKLLGLGDIPPLAGRPPTYLVRQLWNYQSGERRGSFAAPMQAVVAGMRVDEMLAIAAYLASLPPD
jgi:cytochrome c553